MFFPPGRIYKCLFTGSVSSLLTLPLDMLSTWVIMLFLSSTVAQNMQNLIEIKIVCLFIFFTGQQMSNRGSFLLNMCYCFYSYRENLLADCLQGCFVVTCTLCAFISLVWLREQIVHGGAPQWLEQHQPPQPNAAGQANEVLCWTDY